MFRGITKEDYGSMQSGDTSVLELASRRRLGGSEMAVRAGLAIALACGPVSVALAQGSQASTSARNSNQLQQTLREGHGGRLLVPISGTLGLAATTAAPPPSTPRPDAATVAGEAAASMDNGLSPAVAGSFSIERFARTTDGGIAAVGTFTLSVPDPASNAGRTIITAGAMPLSIGGRNPASGDRLAASTQGLAQACGPLALVLGQVDVDLPGAAVRLDDVNVEFVPGVDERLASALCEVAGAAGQAAAPADLVVMLNSLVQTIG
jgi:hypothetical protein